MVEVSLALLILSIGVLTMVGLMSGGLDMSKSSMDYTQTAIFASDTLEGVRYYSSTVTNSTVGNPFWQGLKNGLALKAVVGSAYDTDTQGELLKNSTAYLNFFYSYQTNVDFACRYRVSVEQCPGLTGTLADQVAAVKLDVINGLFGGSTTQSFYTEVMQFVR